MERAVLAVSTFATVLTTYVLTCFGVMTMFRTPAMHALLGARRIDASLEAVTLAARGATTLSVGLTPALSVIWAIVGMGPRDRSSEFTVVLVWLFASLMHAASMSSLAIHHPAVVAIAIYAAAVMNETDMEYALVALAAAASYVCSAQHVMVGVSWAFPDATNAKLRRVMDSVEFVDVTTRRLQALASVIIVGAHILRGGFGWSSVVACAIAPYVFIDDADRFGVFSPLDQARIRRTASHANVVPPISTTTAVRLDLVPRFLTIEQNATLRLGPLHSDAGNDDGGRENDDGRENADDEIEASIAVQQVGDGAAGNGEEAEIPQGRVEDGGGREG
jgi:hypothetical protein